MAGKGKRSKVGHAAGTGRRKRRLEAPKASPGEDGSNKLWGEIQKLGGDMADLKMLQDVDTAEPPKKTGQAKVDSSALQGDLSAFAKSLGLSTSAAEFAGMPAPEPAKAEEQVPKKKKKKSKNKFKPDVEDKTEAVDSAKEKAPETKAPKAGVAKGKAAKAGRLVIEPTAQWFAVELGPLEGSDTVDADTAVEKLEQATALLERENEVYDARGLRQKSLSTADRSFMSNILKSGTLSDRVSALTLMVQQSPVHAVRALGQLMQMVTKNNRREAMLAVGSVKDLMLINLLPEDRKLRHFAEQPLGAKGITEAHWIMWAFEDQLKRQYFDLIQMVEELGHDPVLHRRQAMANVVGELLEQKPEQERNLLRLLVNKLGDGERQLAAKASHLLLRLLSVHPNMKLVVVRTIQELILARAATKERTQYYTMITLNQVVLSARDGATAGELIGVYFGFFTRLLRDGGKEGEDEGESEKKKDDKKAQLKRRRAAQVGKRALQRAKEEAREKHEAEARAMDNRLLGAVLTGLSRALPFAEVDEATMDAHVSSVFQVAHAGNFSTVVQALVLLAQIARVRPAVRDRFYRTLYDSLFDARLDASSKKAMYLNVLYRALREDTDTGRVAAFVRRMTQTALYSQAEFASGALLVLSQVLSQRPQLYAMLTQPPDNEAEDDGYDARKRDPRYAGAAGSCLWEATLLARHFHPSITHSVAQISAQETVPPISNLHNHSLTLFLDRFVFRKPKAASASQSDLAESATLRGQSLMQPLVASQPTAGDHPLVSKRISGAADALIQDLASGAIADRPISDVRPEDQFFHQFFSTKRERMGKRKPKAKVVAKDDFSDEDGGDKDTGDAEFGTDATGFASAVNGEEMDEDEIWKAMTADMPGGVPSDGEDDSDGGSDNDSMLAALRDSDDEGSEGFEGFEDESEGDSEEDGSEEESEGGSDDDDAVPSFDDKIEATEDGDSSGAKRKADDSEAAPKRKKREKVPMFGSFEDYAHLIDTDEGLAGSGRPRPSVFVQDDSGGEEQPLSPLPPPPRRRKLDTFMEELQQQQAQRQAARRSEESSTNLHVTNLHPELDEQALSAAFGEFGTIASVKIMWPRGPEATKPQRQRNGGFVGFMDRASAARALAAMDGRRLHGLALHVGWARPIRLPTAAAAAAAASSSSSSSSSQPFGAVGAQQADAIGEVHVRRPLDARQAQLVHWAVENVLRHGPALECLLVARTVGDARFGFLHDTRTPAHAYYRWRLFSLLAGDTKTAWRRSMFFMYRDGPVWLPPNPAGLGGQYDDDGSDAEEAPTLLHPRDRAQLERLVACARSGTRGDVACAMCAVVEHAYDADAVTDTVASQLIAAPAPPEKLGLLMLVSDILLNCGAPVRGAWRLRDALAAHLPCLFANLHAAYTAIDARLQAERFRTSVLGVLAVWDARSVFSSETLRPLASIFLPQQAIS
ncbi:RNA-binding ribosome biosynthesis protein mak21 [Coemansia sp. RSA 552]|nr:RNA-binding ribosome biosynthesis protein mak21 [Coemansia sp. RSA 552]